MTADYVVIKENKSQSAECRRVHTSRSGNESVYILICTKAKEFHCRKLGLSSKKSYFSLTYQFFIQTALKFCCSFLVYNAMYFL